MTDVTSNVQSTDITAKAGATSIVVGICLLAWTLTNMDQALFGYAIPGILTEFHQPLQTIGTMLTISFVSAAGLVVLAGMAADRWGRVPTLTLLLAASASLVGLQSFATDIVTLTILRALAFGLSGGLAPITNAMVVEAVHERWRGIAAGVLQCGYPLGWFLAALLAAPLLTAYGWRAICLIALGVVPLSLLIGWLLRRFGPAIPLAASADGIKQTASNNQLGALFAPEFRRNSLASAAMFFLFGGAYAGSAFFFPTFFTQVRGYTEADATALVGLSNGIGIFGYLAAAFVGEFLIPRQRVFTLWCLGGALCLLGLFWLSNSPAQDTIWYGLTAALFFGSQAVVIVMIAEIYPVHIRATAIAVCGSAPLSLGFAIFPILVPQVVAQAGWSMGLSLVIVPLLVGSAIAGSALRIKAAIR
jgi:MFS family permease